MKAKKKWERYAIMLLLICGIMFMEDRGRWASASWMAAVLVFVLLGGVTGTVEKHEPTKP